MKINQEMKRKIVQVAAFGYSNTYIGNFVSGQIYKGSWKQFCNPGMNCYSCPAARLACPIGAMQAVSGSMNFKLSFYVIGFVLALGVVFGRAICGFFCPFGLIQELIYKIPFPKKKLWKWLTYVKYVLLAVFVIIMPVTMVNTGNDTLFIISHTITTFNQSYITYFLLFYIHLFKINLYIKYSAACLSLSCRFFCKVMCPLGAIYGLLNKVSIYHMEYNKKTCVSCGKCHSICPMDVDPVKNPNSAECIRCGKCVASCPKESLALKFVYGKKG